MKTNITKEDVLKLKEEFLEYAYNAEQHEFMMLAMIQIKLDQSIEEFDSMDDIEKNAMFRTIYNVIGKDFSEYESKS